MRNREVDFDSLPTQEQAAWQNGFDEGSLSVTAVRCARHVSVPKLNVEAHGEAECGACAYEGMLVLLRAVLAASGPCTPFRSVGETFCQHGFKPGHCVINNTRARLQFEGAL